MEFVVIGLGSMGKRRVRLLQRISENFRIYGVDGRSDRRKQAKEEYSIETFSNLDEVFAEKKPECAIVSTSPLSHADIIETCLKHDCHVFTEINLVNNKYESNMNLAKNRNLVLFLSSTFLYRSEVNYIREKVIHNKSKLNYIYHVGQYLPDWHPWESINDYFIGEKETNGCREIFTIEFPWIIKTFGEIDSFEVVSGKISELQIQYNDNYLLLIKHKNGNNGAFAVDVVSRKATRFLEIYGENLYLTWDGTPTGLFEFDCMTKSLNNVNLYETVDKQDGYASYVIENDYQNELESFIRQIHGDGEVMYSFEEDYYVLEMIDKIETGVGK